ncbi:MAG: iron ABC transporter permease [Bacteroidales bacterium]|nr:iron ABC transporter permease [Bacteroidales bacterium]
MPRKKKTDPTKGNLSKEFFGDANAAKVPGQDEDTEGSANLFEAITGINQDDSAEQEENYELFDHSEAAPDLGPDYNKPSWFRLHPEDPNINPYAASQDKRYSLDPRAAKVIRLLVIGIVALIVIIMLPSPSYNTEFSYTFAGIVTALTGNVQGLFDFIGGKTQVPEGLINYKACTYLIIFFAGMALAVTGAIYQGSLRNALASPTTLGINAGGTVGVAIFAILAPVELLDPIFGEELGYIDMTSIIDYYNSLSLSEYLLVTEGRAFASIIGCFIAVGLVMTVSRLVGRGSTSGFSLIICGQVVAAVAQSVVEVIRYYAIETDTTGTQSTVIRGAQAGSISEVSTPLDLLLVAVPVLVCLIIIIALRRRINLLAFSDEEARSMGIATERLRWVIVGVCTLMTAVIISFCGNIAFVGFAIPLIIRRYVGPDFNYLIPASALLGGTLLIATYWFTDLGIASMFGLPASVNTITSLVGTVMFIVVTLQQRKANRSSDWL